MKAKVVYFTKTGNTQKIAQAIAAELGCDVAGVDAPLTERVDTLFLGASVYKMGVDKSVLQFIDALDPALVGQVALFSTSAMADSGYAKLVKRLADKNIKVAKDHFYCKGSFMFMNKNRPNQEDETNAAQFAKAFQ